MSLKFVMFGPLRTASNVRISESLHEVYTASSEQVDFTLGGTYRPGAHELEVYLNGVRQTVDVDYQEIDDKLVHFLQPLEEGDKVLFIVQEVRNSTMYQEFDATAGQTVFSLLNPYHVGYNTLQVHYNGVLLRRVDDYVELDEYNVQLLFEAEAAAKVTFREIM